MNNILDCTRDNLSEIFKKNNISKHHLKKVIGEIYKEKNTNPFLSDKLPNSCRHLDTKWNYSYLKIKLLQHSKEDHSIKFLLEIGESQHIEAILMPEKNRITACISSQLGCKQACAFCFTGKMKIFRNLEASQIIAQILTLNHWLDNNSEWFKETSLDPKQRISNVVFMGMGEPLDNVHNVVKAVKILQDPWGLELAPKRITISTAGHLDGLKYLLESNVKVSLALSVHSVNSLKRSQIMPINKKFPLEKVIHLAKEYTLITKKKLFIQYTMFKDLNDSDEDAQNLAKYFTGIPVKINLIPFNTVENLKFETPSIKRIKKFQSILLAHGYRTMIRFSKGQDINAACGQLNSQS